MKATTHPGSCSSERSIGSETTLCKRLPDQTLVLAPRIDVISLNDGIAVVKDARPARLKLEAIDEKLNCIGVSMLGILPSRLVGGSVEGMVAGRGSGIDSRREEGL